MLPWDYPIVPLGRPKVIALDFFGIILDREGAICHALDPWSPFAGDRDLVALYLEIEARVAHIRSTMTCSLAEIVYATLTELAEQLDVPREQRALQVASATTTILTPAVCSDVVEALRSLMRCGYTVICIPAYSQTTMDHLQRSVAVPPGMGPLYLCPAAALPHFSSYNVFSTLHRQCNLMFPGGVRPEEILVVSTGVGRMLVPALLHGHTTALVRRSRNIEANVDFRVNDDEGNPKPSVIVDDLRGLCRVLENSTLSPSPAGRSDAKASQTAEANTRSPKDRDDSPDQHASSRIDRYMQSFTICGTYQVTHILGEGARGYVLRAFNFLTGSEVAIKVEQLPVDDGMPAFLEYESIMHKLLAPVPTGIPAVHWTGRDGNHAIIIMDRVGPNLNALRRFCRGSFTLRTICMLANQMLSRLEFVHWRGIVVCDLRPHNFAMGMNVAANVLYLLDFGHARLYIDPSTGAHVPNGYRDHPAGALRYASVAAHAREGVSRRDDIESLLYVLLDLYKGTLPWSDTGPGDWQTLEQGVRECKAGDGLRAFLADLPPEFTEYYAHYSGLSFGQKPDYCLLRNLFRRRMREEGWPPDSEYDWIDGRYSERGTLIPEEYVMDVRFVGNVDLDP